LQLILNLQSAAYQVKEPLLSSGKVFYLLLTMKELHDLLDALPYWLLLVLPVFIALSPYNPVCDASELNFPIHRLAQYEISGNRLVFLQSLLSRLSPSLVSYSRYGSKTAALSIEARTASTAPSNLLRKIVIAKMHGL